MIKTRDILGEGTWNKYLEKLKPRFVISHAYGQHVLTKVAQSVNIDVLKQEYYWNPLAQPSLLAWQISKCHWNANFHREGFWGNDFEVFCNQSQVFLQSQNPQSPILRNLKINIFKCKRKAQE